jgi:hypothetical protein
VRLGGVFLLVVSGCGRIGFDSRYGDAFLVSTLQDRLAGPTTAASLEDLNPGLTDLSLREALTIASNSPEPMRIQFDPRIFPPGGSATITLGSPLPAIAGNGITIDARAVGVTLDGTFEPLIDIGGSNNGIQGVGFAGTGTRVHVNGRFAAIEHCRFAGGGIAIDIEGSAVHAFANVIVGGSMTGIRMTNVTSGSALYNEIDGVAGDAITVSNSSDVSLQDNNIVLGDKAANRGISLDTVSSAKIIDNIIDPGSARLIELNDSPDATIIGNILDRGDVGVVLGGASTNAYVFRNVVIAPVDEPMYIADTATGARVVNNTLYMSGAIAGATDTVEVNTLDADTGFAAPDQYDFRLLAGNPAIDQGMDVGQDMLGTSSKRFLGAAPDLGAVESY